MEKDKAPVSLISTQEEDKLLLEVLDDFCKAPMDYDLSEMCEKEEMEEMAGICEELRNEFHNRSMHISGLLKADIDDAKADIDDAKADIVKLLMNIDEEIKNKTVMHIVALYEECGKDDIFGRSIVEKVTGLKSTRASEIIKLMMENDVIETVKGHGKGKYRFK